LRFLRTTSSRINYPTNFISGSKIILRKTRIKAKVKIKAKTRIKMKVFNNGGYR